jgi:hypothetical protein
MEYTIFQRRYLPLCTTQWFLVYVNLLQIQLCYYTAYHTRDINAQSQKFFFLVTSSVKYSPKKIKMALLWVVASCCLVEVYRQLRGTCCDHG